MPSATRTFSPRRIAATSLAVVLLLPVTAPTGSRAAGPTVIDTNDRQAVFDSYAAEFGRVGPPMGFTGSVDKCIAGTTSDAFQASILQRVNWYRSMAGLPPVAYNPTNHPAAQAGALISAANGALSHTPSASARCFSDLGYTGTSSSNLALGGVGVFAIDQYIDDLGDNNTFVGHRRWILSPELRAIASGDIPAGRHGSGQPWGANALFVFDTGPPVAARDTGIAWPPPGHVPAAVAYERWSYVRLGADFSSAQVSVTGPSGPVTVKIESREDWMGAGIVFVPDIPSVASAKNPRDTTYDVAITGVGGVPGGAIRYSTTIAAMNVPPALGEPQVKGNRCSGRSLSVAVDTVDPEADFSEDPIITIDKSLKDGKLFMVSADSYSGAVVFRPRRALDLDRSDYSFEVVAKDAKGASARHTIDFTVPLPDASSLCPPRSLSIRNTRAGTRVSWKAPPIGASPTKYSVRVSPGGARCSSTLTSCVVRRLKKGRYTIKVTATRPGSRPVSATTTLTRR